MSLIVADGADAWPPRARRRPARAARATRPAARPVARDGRRQRDARTRSPTAAAGSTPTPPSRTGSRWSPSGADLLDVGGESTRPGATAAAGRRGAAPGPPGHRGARRRRASSVSVDTMRAEVAERGARGRRGRRQRRLRRARRPRDPRRSWRRSACRTSRCTGAGTPTPCSSCASTTTWSPTCVDELGRAARRAPRGRASPASGSSSTRGSASPRQPSTTGRCCAASTSCSRSAARCWSAPAASRSSATLLAGRRGAPRPVDEREAATALISALAAAAGAGRPRARRRRHSTRCASLRPGTGRRWPGRRGKR